VAAAAALSDRVTPDEVCRLLARLSESQLVIIILDEFDRISSATVRRAMADTIKALSDNAVPATIVIVGVADTVDELIAEHRSIERAIVQVPMRRMKTVELEGILANGAARLEVRIGDASRRRIAILSQGLPHYTHLLGLHAVRAALDEGVTDVDSEHVKRAIARAVEDSEQSLRHDLMTALSSSARRSIYGEVLLACAVAKPDEFGYFAASAVRGPLSAILKQPCQSRTFSKHLDDLCHPSRGALLARTGVARRFRFRFSRPLMQPLIIMKGLVDRQIDEAAIQELP
jgi:hypothetical protein